MIDSSRHLSGGFFCVLCVMFAGCQSGPASREIYYQLAPEIQERHPDREACGTVLTSRLGALGFAGGRAIVFRDRNDSLEIQRYNYHHWSEPPALMIQDAIVRSLRAAGLTRYVITPNERANADWIVSGSLIRLEHFPNSSPARVEIEVELGLVATASHETLFLERYLEIEPAASNGLDDAVQAFNQALERMLARFQNGAGKVLTRRRSDCR
ncbi:MAG: ABC-type transport auxiliary lipoprotein family protein [Methylococcales bacterium]